MLHGIPENVPDFVFHAPAVPLRPAFELLGGLGLEVADHELRHAPTLRTRARAAGKSLNEAAVDALAEGSGLAGARRKRRDLADIARTWKAEKAVDAALADQDRIDEDLWR